MIRYILTAIMWEYITHPTHNYRSEGVIELLTYRDNRTSHVVTVFIISDGNNGAKAHTKTGINRERSFGRIRPRSKSFIDSLVHLTFVR